MPGQLQDGEYQAFVLCLIEARTQAQMTQAELAALLGKPQSYVSKYERFERRLDVSEWRRAASALGSDPHALFAQALRRTAA